MVTRNTLGTLTETLRALQTAKIPIRTPSLHLNIFTVGNICVCYVVLTFF